MPAVLSRRLFNTTAFRAALLYTCAFSLLATLGMGFIYWSTKSQIEAQADARLRLETDVLLGPYQRVNMSALLDTVRRRNLDDGSGGRQPIFFYAIWGADRGWLAGDPPRGLSTSDFTELLQRGSATVRLGQVLPVEYPEGSRWVRVLWTALPGNYLLVVGRNFDEQRELLAHTLTTIIAATAVTFLLALAVSLLLGRYSLRRIDAISRITAEFMAGDHGKRLPQPPLRARGSGNEFDQLTRNLNAMLARIEELLAGMRQVTDNVAHDLRKPLNRLRNRLEITLLEARTEDEYRAVLEHGIQDTDEMLKTFNALLSIAQAEAGIRRNQWGRVDLGQLVEDVAELYEALAEDAGIELCWSAQPGLIIGGNRQLLAQALGNLLDNAVKYTPRGGRIALRVARSPDDGAPLITVTDTGPGIPPADRERAQQRFVRLDGARQMPGNGLGLSLVRAVAKLHGAAFTLDDANADPRQPGLRAQLRFPQPDTPG